MTFDKNELSKIATGYTKIITKIFHIGLDNNTISIYTYLCSCKEDYHPSINQICRILKISRPTVMKGLKTLQQKNIIKKEVAGNSHMSTKYKFLPPSEWI
jgi:predicted DNA-binding transcriptional regulator